MHRLQTSRCPKVAPSFSVCLTKTGACLWRRSSTTSSYRKSTGTKTGHPPLGCERVGSQVRARQERTVESVTRSTGLWVVTHCRYMNLNTLRRGTCRSKSPQRSVFVFVNMWHFATPPAACTNESAFSYRKREQRRITGGLAGPAKSKPGTRSHRVLHTRGIQS